MDRVLITGGAGFIGQRLTRALLAGGGKVVVFDNLSEQVHGRGPVSVPEGVELIHADVRNPDAVREAVHRHRPDTIVHLAAETGTAQSGSMPSHYCAVNVVGTANLVECLTRPDTAACRLVLASTRAVYGEGAHRGADGRVVNPDARSEARLRAGVFEVFDEQGHVLSGMPTVEQTPPRPISVYGSTKLMQEHLVEHLLAPGRRVVLRLQNVYGPGQSLRNSYTGVLTHFCTRALAGETVPVFEDGKITRDFVHVDDVVRAFVMACSNSPALGQTINIGRGEGSTLHQAALEIAHAAGLSQSKVRITGEFRSGDVRHASADITRASNSLGWKPEIGLAAGVASLVAWARGQAGTS